MVRSEVFLHNDPPMQELPTSQILPVMLVASLSLVLLRAAVLTYHLWLERDDTGEPSGKNIPRGVPFFVAALANILIRLGSATGHGLLAINWVLAGAEPGMQLVACFVLVAINTHMLSSVALVVHLRSLLAAVAIYHQSRVKFEGISHLWGAPAGIACLALNGLSTAILLAHLYERPERIVTWLATAAGFLLWANSSFRSVGLMDGQTWKEISESELDDSAISVSDFLRNLGIRLDDEADRATAAPLWLQILRFNFKHDDELLLRHRQALLRRAYPQSPRLRIAHGATVLLLALLSSAVPALLVAHCLSRVPLLRDVELVGGVYFPSLSSSRQDYYIAIEDSGSNGISMTFQMELGEASFYRFCCRDASCSAIESNDQKSQLRLKLMIAPEQFGTCQLQLRGLQSNTYNFTVLSLRHLSTAMNAELEAPFAPYRAKQHAYDSDLVKPDGVDELVLTSTLQIDASRIRPSLVAQGLGSTGSTLNATGSLRLEHSKSFGSVTLKANISELREALNVTLIITLQPEDESVDLPSQINSNVYQVSVRVFTIEERLKHLLSEISELQGRIDANQELSSPLELAENLRKLEKATVARNELLRRAYRNQHPDARFVNSERVTFLTIGVTGTGKSELCRWMTGKADECQSSDSMESHTSEIHRIQAHAFGDNRLQPLIEWIDTPGRGDTRGESYDSKLWNRTMSQLLQRGKKGAVIDRIVWVVNAAWQRATELRNRMLQELRMSFGVDLYQNLVIMLNFLPHSANKTEYDEVKRRQKEKFVNWIMKREDEMFHWPPALRGGIEKEVTNIQVYGADINPKFLNSKPGDVPISAPYLHSFPPFSHPAGVLDLMAMIRETWEKKTGSSGLLLDNPHPRIGPGKLEKVSLDFKCMWQAQEDGPDNSLIIEPDAKLEVEGTSFSQWDKALVVSNDLACGVRDPDDWISFDWFDKRMEVAVLGSENTSRFDVKEWDEGEEQKLCFCEAPSCNETWRFGQEQPLPTKQCPELSEALKRSPLELKQKAQDTTLQIDGANSETSPAFFLASVQGRVLGIPSESGGDALYEFHFDGDDAPRTTRHELKEEYRKKWLCSNVLGTRLFALDQSGEFILVVDVDQDPLGFSQLGPMLHGKDEAEELPYNGLVAAPSGQMYLVPGKASHVGILELEQPSRLKKIKLPSDGGCLGPWDYDHNDPTPDKLCNQFASPCLAEGKLFAPPWEAGSYLVLDLEKPEPELVPVTDQYWGWAAFAESNGIVYGCPYFEKEVLIIDAKNHKKHMRLSPVESFFGDWRFSSTGKEACWTDLLPVEGHLFFAPGGDGAPVIMDPKFSNFWKFPEEEEETSMPMQQMPKQGIRKQGRTKRAAQRAPARQRMTKRPGKAKKSFKGGKNRKAKAFNGGVRVPLKRSLRGDQPWKRASKGGRTPIEKVRRTIVLLGNKLILSPGNSKHLLIVNLLSGINTTLEEDNEVLSVRQRLDKQLEEAAG